MFHGGGPFKIFMKFVQIQNLTKPLKLPIEAGYCSSFLCQLRGLTFRSHIQPSEGLLLVQKRDSRLDSSIHMMFVWTDLAVVWINEALEVVDKRLAKKWVPGYIPAAPARYVLELSPDRLLDFDIGDRIEFR
jgi:uncharacterized membrane protein (UPF0127 family)